MKLNQNFVLKEYDGEHVLIYQDEKSVDFSKFIALNSLGYYIYNLLKENKSEEEILSSILDNYQIDQETASKDLQEFLEKLKKEKILFE